jgi:DNA-binding NtrC family response regulator
MHDKILICDDENMLRSMLGSYLSDKGFEVIEAKDGAECIARIGNSNDKCSAILMDVKMPQMDGVTATQELRKRGVTTPIFLMSGFGDIASTEEAQRIGANRFFAKPFALEALFEAIVSY